MEVAVSRLALLAVVGLAAGIPQHVTVDIGEHVFTVDEKFLSVRAT